MRPWLCSILYDPEKDESPWEEISMFIELIALFDSDLSFWGSQVQCVHSLSLVLSPFFSIVDQISIRSMIQEYHIIFDSEALISIS